jgi:UDP-N-acetylmuramate--alanine ligase
VGPSLDRLEARGARITTAQNAESIPADAQLVVASAAIPPDHAELAEARRRGVETLKYAEMLGALMQCREGIAVSGAHGKSTTTAWLAYVLRRAGLDPSFVVGAECEQLGGGSGVGDGPHFLAEACEYDRSFLNLRPRSAAVLNIDEDHLDYYRDLDEIAEAFTEFAAGVPEGGRLVLNGDDPRCRAMIPNVAAGVETFGLGQKNTWRAAEPALDDGFQSFTAVHRDRPLGRVRLGIPGAHNVGNALAVIALARGCGVAWPVIADGLASFRGAKRRLEQRGHHGGVTIVDDYAHHPAEIRATLLAARERFAPQRLWCVFQPHQHSRTRFLLEDFAASFKSADRVIVPDIYFVRDTHDDRQAVCSADLVERIRGEGGHAEYVPRFEAIVEHLTAELAPGDLVITMGAGNIWKIADVLVQRLRIDLPV